MLNHDFRIAFNNVGFAYGGRQVLRDFSLTLDFNADRCMTVAICGKSGGGKTTLLRLLAGLEQPTSGEIVCCEKSRVAMMFQENRLLPGLAAEEQLAVVLPKGEDVLPWLRAVGLENELGTLPQQMSGGMQRRLALARCMAFAQDKELLLLDEPFAGVDVGSAAAIMPRLKAMQKPLIFTAHDSESLAMADRVICLDDIM